MNERIIMHIQKNDVPVRIGVPGATARQAYDFGNAAEYDKFAAEHFSLAAGTDFAPLLQGLEDDLCQSPHWGYVIEGLIHVTYTDGQTETASKGDLFYWPPGHTIRVEHDAEFVCFSPQAEHCAVVDHVQKQLAGV
jgi:mannose-6-phosphate isomerase-like protein (cupin superfamily)